MALAFISEPNPTCKARVDIGFIFEPYEKYTVSYQRYFLKTIASFFGVTKSSRISVVALQKKPQLSIRFGDHSDITSFNKAVDGIQQTRGDNGPHHLGESLTIARDHMFNNGYSNPSKLLIILKRDLSNRYGKSELLPDRKF